MERIGCGRRWDLEEEETQANKGGLLTFLDIEWNELDHENLVEFQNIFLLKGMKFILGGEV